MLETELYYMISIPSIGLVVILQRDRSTALLPSRRHSKVTTIISDNRRSSPRLFRIS